MLAVAVVLINPTLQMPAITKFIDGSGLVFAGPVFPFVCITIACGAVSGFHSLIASGTTPKMIRRESRIRSIGYGAMVTEMMVALMAMIAACVLEPGEYFAINTKGAPSEVVAKVSAVGFPVTEQQMQVARHRSWRVHNVQPRGWRADVCRRNGAHVCPRVCEPDCAGALVSLRDHVRGAVHSDDDRCRNTRRTVFASGCSGLCVAAARQHALLDARTF